MIDNQTSLLNSHTSKTSTNQNAQPGSNSVNYHASQVSNTQAAQPPPGARRHHVFAKPRPKSTKKAQPQMAALEGTFVHSQAGKAGGHSGNAHGPFSKSSRNAVNTDSIEKHSAQKTSSHQSHNEKLLAAALDNNVLDYSPFNFLQGINPRRLVKGRSLLGRTSLVDALKCAFCNCVVVQGQECDSCESNFCSPCTKQWLGSEAAKIYCTPCKCPDGSGLKQLNRLKQEYLNQVRFKCNSARCTYHLTYDELLLGTHELDDCDFMNIICEGCGVRIFKQDRIRHESVECANPIGKCAFCQRIFGMSEMLVHRRECGQRSVVKVEYVNNPEAAALAALNQSKFSMMEFDQRPDQEYRPSGNSSGSKSNSHRQQPSKASHEKKAAADHGQTSKSHERQRASRTDGAAQDVFKGNAKGAKRVTRREKSQPQLAQDQAHRPLITLCQDCGC